MIGCVILLMVLILITNCQGISEIEEDVIEENTFPTQAKVSSVNITPTKTGDNVRDTLLAYLDAFGEDGGTLVFGEGNYVLEGAGNVSAYLRIDQSISVQGEGEVRFIKRVVDGNRFLPFFQVVKGGRLHIANIQFGAEGFQNENAAIGTDIHGGLIIIDGGEVEISGSILQGGIAALGGAVYCTGGGTLIIENSTIKNNSSEGSGGGLYINDCTVEIRNSTISANYADLNGGGVFLDRGTLHLHMNSQLESNDAELGGALYIDENGQVHIQDSVFRLNMAQTGGSIYSSGIVDLFRSSLDGNLAYDGGAFYNVGTTTISQSTLVSNRADHYGGAVFNDEFGQITIMNCTLAKNRSEEGGALYNLQTANLDFCSIVNNTSIYEGVVAGGSGITVKNSIFADNAPWACYVFAVDGLGDNLDDSYSCNTPQDDPLIGELENLGGLQEGYPLLSYSPAVNAVSDCTTINGDAVLFDQAGNPRPFGITCDLGALELQEEPTLRNKLTATSNTTCREKPGSEFMAIGHLVAGQQAEVVGINPNQTWYRIIEPNNGKLCWVWRELVIFTGDLDSLQVIAPEQQDEDEGVCQPPPGGCDCGDAEGKWNPDLCICVCP